MTLTLKLKMMLPQFKTRRLKGKFKQAWAGWTG